MASLQRSEANAKLPYSIILSNKLNKDNAKLYKWQKNMPYNYALQELNSDTIAHKPLYTN